MTGARADSSGEGVRQPDMRACILVVDDVPANLKQLVEMLGGAGYRVRPAQGGEMALQAATLVHPDLILLDIRMPGLDGFEVCRLLKRNPALAEVPVIFVSALDDVEDKVAAFDVGGADYVCKPYQQSEVLARVRLHLERRRLQVSLERARDELEERVRQRTAELEERNRALEESEERFRVLVQRAPEAIVVYDAMLERFVEANANAERMFGLTREALLESGLHQWYSSASPPQDSISVLEHFAQALVGQDVAFETAISTAEGETRLCEVRLVSLPSAGQRLVRASILDISDRKRAEEEKLRLEQELNQARRLDAIGQLAAGVAHDFNNMLTVMLGHCEMACAKIDKPEGLCNNLDKIRRAGERARELTSQLLAFGRKQVLELTAIDVNDAVRRALSMLERILGGNVEIVTRLCPALPRVKADAAQLEMAIVNLAVNARDAMPDGGRLSFETQLTAADGKELDEAALTVPAFVTLSVTDTGNGMDPETLRHVFEPFFTTKAKGKGTGLGLATVHGIVSQHGGRIEVSSSSGAGTCFRLHFPRAPEVAVASHEEQGPATARDGNETVLLVEDDFSVREVVVELLVERGYRVRQAASGREALAVAMEDSEPIDLVISDFLLRDMNGHQLRNALAPIRPGLRVLYMTGHAEASVSSCGRVGGVSFIQKPFTGDGLAWKVREAITRGAGGAEGRVG